MRILEWFFSIKNFKDEKVFTFFGFKYKKSRFLKQKYHDIDKSKPTIALQVESTFDKGGVSEVVYQIARTIKKDNKYNVVILSQVSQKGYLADLARTQGIYTYSFFHNEKNVKQLVEILNIKLVNCHFNIFGIDEYKNANVKVLYTIHNNYIWLSDEEIEKRKQEYKLIDYFNGVSSQVIKHFSKKFDIDINKIKLIENGIDYINVNSIKPISKKEINFSDDDFILLDIANFNCLKYHFTLILALEKLVDKYKNIKLVLIGGIQDKVYYSNFIKFLKSSKVSNNVKIINFVPKNEIYSYLKMADCFVMSSISEGFSIAKLEAMMFEKPLVLTQVGAAEDVIKNNDIGYLIQPIYDLSNNIDIKVSDIKSEISKGIYKQNNVDDFVLAIEDMYINKEKWKDKAKLANLKVKNDYNVQTVMSKYLQLFDTMLQK